MRHGGKTYSDTTHRYCLNSTCDVVENKRQRHATLPFSKSTCDMGTPPVRALGCLMGMVNGCLVLHSGFIKFLFSQSRMKNQVVSQAISLLIPLYCDQ